MIDYELQRKQEALYKAQYAKNKANGDTSRKGIPNQIGAKIYIAIEEAYDRLGGVDYLVELGKEEPAIFSRLLEKCLPKDMTVLHNFVAGGDGLQNITVNFISDKCGSSEVIDGEVVTPEQEKLN